MNVADVGTIVPKQQVREGDPKLGEVRLTEQDRAKLVDEARRLGASSRWTPETSGIGFGNGAGT